MTSVMARETASVAEPSPMDTAEAATATGEAATATAEAATHMATAKAAAMAATKATTAVASSSAAPAGETISRHDADGESGNRRRDDHHLVQHDMLLWTRCARPFSLNACPKVFTGGNK
jgi:hypothetical protein